MINSKNYLYSFLDYKSFKSKAIVFPKSKQNFKNDTERIFSLLNIYKMFVPSKSTYDIYTKFYFAVFESLNRKNSKEENELIFKNFKCIKEKEKIGIIGGLDSFKIVGPAGVGKSAAVEHIKHLISHEIIKVEKPFRLIIPILSVECVSDFSIKSLLLSVIKKIDDTINTKYFESLNKSTVTTDVLLFSVANILTNHVCLLVIDEIERLAIDGNKGIKIVNYLTQLINISNVSICFVGNEGANSLFNSQEYLCRRTIGLTLNKMKYDENYFEFMDILFRFQYSKNKCKLDSQILETFYKLTSGSKALIVQLYVEAQREAITDGLLSINFQSVIDTFQKYFISTANYLNEDKKVVHKPIVINRIEKINIKKRNNNECKTNDINLLFCSNRNDKEAFLKSLDKICCIEYI